MSESPLSIHHTYLAIMTDSRRSESSSSPMRMKRESIRSDVDRYTAAPRPSQWSQCSGQATRACQPSFAANSGFCEVLGDTHPVTESTSVKRALEALEKRKGVHWQLTFLKLIDGNVVDTTVGSLDSTKVKKSRVGVNRRICVDT